MNYNHFYNLSCYEEFEIQCALAGISKIDILKAIGNKKDDYYFFVSEDGVFNWFDLEGNHIEDPCILKELRMTQIPMNILKCIIPNSIISIGEYAFYHCKSLKEITIPNTVTSIGEASFSECKSLKEITIPNGITYIGNYAFFNCKSLKKITIPGTVTIICNYAFFNCKSLKKITIPNSVTNIGAEAFRYCYSLTSITVPDTVTSIGDSAFSNCKSLNEIIFKGKTLKAIKRMKNFPFGIEDKSVFKFS